MPDVKIPPRDPATFSRVERVLAELPDELADRALAEFMASVPRVEQDRVVYAWEAWWARPDQMLPVGPWNTWMIRAGRGYGKTRTGAEAVRKIVEKGQARQVTIIGTTPADARDVMIEGPESGLLAVHPPPVRPVYEPSKRLVTWPNGSLGHVRSAADPESIRGLQSELVWGDEPGSWRYGEESWDMAQLGNRLGPNPRSILTGTPRPYRWLRDIEAEDGTHVTIGSTFDNLANLAPKFIRYILTRYANSRLGLQELLAQYLEDVEGAFWRLATIEATRLSMFDRDDPWQSLVTGITAAQRSALGLGPFILNPNDASRGWETIVAVDPPAETAECGIIVAAAPRNGRAGHDHMVVLDDQSRTGPPEVWGPQVVQAMRTHNASRIVVERNQGGDMVRSTIHAADPNVRVEKLTALLSKAQRAEPVSALYAAGWIHHLGTLTDLETQMTTWVPDGKKSPDRLDALVHAAAALLAPADAVGPATIEDPWA